MLELTMLKPRQGDLMVLSDMVMSYNMLQTVVSKKLLIFVVGFFWYNFNCFGFFLSFLSSNCMYIWQAEQVKARHPQITYADLYQVCFSYVLFFFSLIMFWHAQTLQLLRSFFCHLQLAGVVAVEVTGGPTIDFVPGRKVSRYACIYLYMYVCMCSWLELQKPTLIIIC